MKKTIILYLVLSTFVNYSQNNKPWKLKGNGNINDEINFLGTKNNQNLILKTNSLERMRIASSGEIGIGTTNPQYTFDLNGTFRFNNGSQESGYVLTADVNGLATWSPLPNNNIWSLNGTNAHFSNGYVGIGTDSPIVPLEVFGNIYLNKPNSNNNVYAFNNDQTSKSAIQVINSLGTSPQSIGIRTWGNSFGSVGMEQAGQGGLLCQNMNLNIGTYTDNELSLWTNNVKRFLIDIEGNIGVGTSAPSANLHVNGNFRLQDGTEGNGYVLTSDSDGLASWQDMSSIGTEANPYSELYTTDFIKIGTSSLFLSSLNSGVDNNIYTTSGNLVINGDEGQGTQYHTIINPNGGNVGVGTKLPKQKLHIDGSLLLNHGATSSYLMFGNGDSSSHPEEWVFNYNNTNLGLEFFKPSYSSVGVKRDVVFLSDDGNVGVGTNNPTDAFQVGNDEYKLVIGSAIGSDLGYGTTYLGFNASRENGEWSTNTDGAHNGGAIIFSDIGGGLSFSNIETEELGTVNQSGITDQTIKENANLYISKNGKIGIGTNDPTAQLEIKNNQSGVYALSIGNEASQGFGLNIVGGTGCDETYSHPLLRVSSASSSCEKDLFMVDGKTGITRAREILVDAEVWPDYVFENTYDLKNIDELDEYITKNKKLPGVPSQEEIIKNGINLGDMDVILMEKIEELTLYLIQLKKENKELKYLIENINNKKYENK